MLKKEKNALKENYLDYIPKKNEDYTWSLNEKKLVVVDIPNKGLHNRIAQKFFHKPKVSHIELDAYGTFIWNYIDGTNTIFGISEEVKKHFGKEAEPLLNRLVKFFQILHENKFILYLGKENK